MNRGCRLAARTVLSAGLLVVWLGSLGLVQRVRAQGPPPSPPPKICTNQTYFKLPVKIDDQVRARLTAVRLYVKQGNSDWQQKETAPANQQAFFYRATQDGEYWFSVVTVDDKGQTNPADVRNVPPNLMVVVDTQPPMVELRASTGPSGEQCLHCLLKDANPDYQSLKLSYRAGDGTWRPLQPMAGLPGAFAVPSPEVLTGTVKVVALDLAKNQTTREISLGESQAGQQVAAAYPPRAVENVAFPAPVAQAQYTMPAKGHADTLPLEAPTPSPAPAFRANPVESAVGTFSPGSTTSQNTSARPAFGGGNTEVAFNNGPAAGGSAPRQLLNTTHAAVEYQLEHLGPSLVSKVEVYITSDGGHTWRRLCEDPDRRSPADIDLPGDGLYGVRLVVTNGNGFGGSPPPPGSEPSCWIEVDTTRPTAQLKEIETMTTGGTLEIRWTASDKNLGTEPINLLYATRREGPWLPIARGLKNEGSYRWAFPRDGTSQFFVRLEVTDLAGNMTRCEPAAPILLDMTEPRALVVGVTGASGRGTAPTGN